MSNEIMEQIKSKEEENGYLAQEVQFKTNRIQEMEEILETKEIPFVNKSSLRSKVKEIHTSQISNCLENSQSFLPHEGTIDFEI